MNHVFDLLWVQWMCVKIVRTFVSELFLLFKWTFSYFYGNLYYFIWSIWLLFLFYSFSDFCVFFESLVLSVIIRCRGCLLLLCLLLTWCYFMSISAKYSIQFHRISQWYTCFMYITFLLISEETANDEKKNCESTHTHWK